jgi:predicted heme/steroid binding protein/uncharacterized membrane protein
MSDPPKYLTIKQLKEFDGKFGRPAYVAFKGIIYDVSKSRLWLDGTHRFRHIAGTELTKEIINAPHKEDVLTKFPVIGQLKEESSSNRFLERIERLHLHSMVVHFSVSFSIAIPVLALIYLVTNVSSFEQASYYLLIALLVITPASGISGIFSWKVTYEGKRTRIFDRKILFTIVTAIMVIGCSVWRVLVPDILIEKTILSYVYFALLASVAANAAMLGHYGGRIVYS